MLLDRRRFWHRRSLDLRDLRFQRIRIKIWQCNLASLQIGEKEQCLATSITIIP